MRTTRQALAGMTEAATLIQIGWQRFLDAKRGQDMVEYALIAGFITVVIAAMVPTQLIPALKVMWDLIKVPLNWASGS